MEVTLKTYNNIFSENKIYAVYSDLKGEIDNYLRLLQDSCEYEGQYITSFEIPITTGFGNEEYVLKWNITEIEKAIKAKKIESQKIDVANPFIWSCPSRLNKLKLFQMSVIPPIKEPIILAFHSGIQKLIVIDGNHRFHIAKSRNEETIEAFILHPKMHLNFMSDKNKNQFIVHHNLFVLNNYAQSPSIRKCVLNDDFGIESFYPILNKKYNFSRYRQFKYRLLRKIVSA